LAQVDHLVILHLLVATEQVGLSLCGRKDVTKERKALEPLPHPERVDHSGHINHPAGTNRTPNQRHHTKHHPHNGCKGSIFIEN
jgi:hypothetical protein